MRFLTISICLLAMSISASAGAISGTVFDPFGRGLPNAPVQAKDAASGTVFKATSSAPGSYAVKDLPAGTYNVTVSIPGLKAFTRNGLKVDSSQTVALDIHIEETSQLSTLGEDTSALTADTNKHAPPAGPTPRTKDGKPDLSGIWWRPTTVDNGKQEFLPSAVAIAKQREDTNRKDSPQAHCLPGAILRLGPVYETVQNASVMVVISDDDSPGFHQIYIDGRKHPKDPTPAWYGSSIGHWEGDTLVVDRVAFDERVWLDQGAHPHSDKLHIVERYRRPDLGHLETETTVDDPGVLAKPFTMKTVSDLAPTEEVLEFICTENNRDVEHLVGK
jgi:Carboxypeptidase regulatory-like domain